MNLIRKLDSKVMALPGPLQTLKNKLASLPIPFIAAEVASRVIIYGVVGVPMVYFLGWITIPALALSAAEPWPTIALAKAGVWLESTKPPALVQKIVQGPVNFILNKIAGNKWWTRLAMLLPGAVVGAFIPIPGVISNSFIKPLADSFFGGIGVVWGAVLGYGLFTAMPKGTQLLTGGLTTAFNWISTKLDSLGNKFNKQSLNTAANGMRNLASLHQQHVTDARAFHVEAWRHALATAQAQKAAASVGAPQRFTTPAWLRRVAVVPQVGREDLSAVRTRVARRLRLSCVLPGVRQRAEIPQIVAPKPAHASRPKGRSL